MLCKIANIYFTKEYIPAFHIVRVYKSILGNFLLLMVLIIAMAMSDGIGSDTISRANAL